jgi:hypothetical protein
MRRVGPPHTAAPTGERDGHVVGEGLVPSRSPTALPYCVTVKGTTAPVFSQAIASFPPLSDMSTKPIEN